MSNSDEILRQLKEEMHNLSLSTIVVHCNERYAQLIGEAKDNLLLKMEQPGYHISDKIRYYDAYWSHQLEQYRWYLDGFIPRAMYKYFLVCRRRDWVMGEIVKKVLEKERAKVGNNPQKIKEIEDEEREAHNEQTRYRHGWDRAKHYLYDPAFVDFMDNVMKESDDKYIEIMLDSKIYS